MSAATALPADAAPKKKGKALLYLLAGAVVLALAGGGGALYLLKKNTAAMDEGEEDSAPAKLVDPKSAPTFLPLDNMVVNLADAGGNRFIQVGLTLQLQDSATAEAVKAFMPSIRSQILLLLSQRSADDVLAVQGKEKLSADIIAAVSRTLGQPVRKKTDEENPSSRKPRSGPVQAVLFSSFIVQ